MDGFQGKEKDIIIFSTVKSENTISLGFLSDERRMNVGLSRAKYALFVVGNAKKLQMGEKWRLLLRYTEEIKSLFNVNPNSIDFFDKPDQYMLNLKNILNC